jgi:hypothetical protein
MNQSWLVSRCPGWCPGWCPGVPAGVPAWPRRCPGWSLGVPAGVPAWPRPQVSRGVPAGAQASEQAEVKFLFVLRYPSEQSPLVALCSVRVLLRNHSRIIQESFINHFINHAFRNHSGIIQESFINHHESSTDSILLLAMAPWCLDGVPDSSPFISFPFLSFVYLCFPDRQRRSTRACACVCMCVHVCACACVCAW